MKIKWQVFCKPSLCQLKYYDSVLRQRKFLGMWWMKVWLYFRNSFWLFKVFFSKLAAACPQTVLVMGMRSQSMLPEHLTAHSNCWVYHLMWKYCSQKSSVQHLLTYTVITYREDLGNRIGKKTHKHLIAAFV